MSNATETTYGSNPSNKNSTPEAFDYSPATCHDGKDNDLDGKTDSPSENPFPYYDEWCLVIN